MSFLKSLPKMAANDIRQRLGGSISPNAVLTVLQIGSPATLIPDFTTTYNTAMLVNIDNAYQQWIVYNRVDAATYFSRWFSTANSLRGLSFTKLVVDTYSALDDINNLLSTNFTQEEVYNDPIVAGDTITIRFTAKSRWFTGQCVIPVEAKHRIVNNKVLAKASYTPNVLRGALRTQTKINPGLLTWNLDYDLTATLSAIIPNRNLYFSSTLGYLGATDAATIASLLKAKDGLPWQASATAGDYNLYNGYMVYNGDALNFNIGMMTNIAGQTKNDTLGLLLANYRLPRLTRRYVAVIMVNSAYCTNLDQDLMFIHYGPALDIVTKDAKPDVKPVHHWPLEGNYRNYGTDSKKPECAIRGSFQVQIQADGGNLLHVHRDTSTVQTQSPIGADLRIDRDFTFSFRYMKGQAATAIANNAVQFYQANNANTTGRLAPQTDNLFAITGSTYTYGAYSDTANWPFFTTVTVTREGDEWCIYHDGMLRSVFRNVTLQTVLWDTLYCIDTTFYLGDIRYYDYALTPSQVQRMLRKDPALSGDAYTPVTTVPDPLWHFPLKGNLLDKTGAKSFITNNLGTAKYQAVTRFDKSTQFYYNTYAGVSALGVPFDRSGDFTLQWDGYFASAQTTAYNMWCDSAGTQDTPILFQNGWIRSNGTKQIFGYAPTAALDNGAANAYSGVYKWTIVKRGRVVYYYLGTKLVNADILSPGATLSPLTYFVTPNYSAVGSIKDVKYWNQALTEDQVIASQKEPF